MSKEEKQTSINHFHEKLFKLKDMMKTEVMGALLQKSSYGCISVLYENSERKHFLKLLNLVRAVE
jgi:hypothetical protein